MPALQDAKQMHRPPCIIVQNVGCEPLNPIFDHSVRQQHVLYVVSILWRNQKELLADSEVISKDHRLSIVLLCPYGRSLLLYGGLWPFCWP